MRYIAKLSPEPGNWRLSFNGHWDYGSHTPLTTTILQSEQHNLCIYCQRIFYHVQNGQEVKGSTATLEHVIPQSHSSEQETSYYNLVAACSHTQLSTHNNRGHCNTPRGSFLIPPLVFLNNNKTEMETINPYFIANQDGTIGARNHNCEPDALKCLNSNRYTKYTTMQVEAFIEHINLNHSSLVKQRNEHIKAIIQSATSIEQRHHLNFWKNQVTALLRDRPVFFEFLALYINETRRNIRTLT